LTQVTLHHPGTVGTERLHVHYCHRLPFVREQAGQQPVEMIMAQGMMAHLITPALLVDHAGTLVFFNAPAARLLGVSYEEAGAMPPEEWAGRFSPETADGEPLSLEQLPISIALAEGRPTYLAMRIHAADGAMRSIEVSAFPIVGRRGQTGALAIFWNGRA
jgi:PAS domain-containing protein